MRSGLRAYAPAAVCVAMLLVPTRAVAWGLGAHRWIALRAAELAGARCGELTRARDVLADHAVEPDTVLKARDGRAETVRHFLDLDFYGAPPFRALPRSYDEAVRRFGRRTIEENGTLPWEGGRLARRLAAELARHDLDAARRTAGYLAHYAGDATMPLHATRNHDGQLTGQRGLHQRIEARLVDARLDDYVNAAAAVRPRQPLPPAGAEGALFAALERAFADVEDVLRADRVARRETSVGSPLYYRRLDRELAAPLAARLGDAAVLTAALWEGACAAAR
jgi:hypothetical protein